LNPGRKKRLASRVAKSVKGVRDVENNIAFVYTHERTDSEIKNDISQALKWDIRVDDALIDVDVKDGDVRLSGMVGSAAEHSQAEVDAWVAGVNSVEVDDLRIAPWTGDTEIRTDKFVEKSNDEIKTAVKTALSYDPRVNSFNPEIEVSEGVVTLSGSVDNLQAKKAAEKVARTIVGVWKVNNLLKS
jgi:osmotically-inducible protein OsmY